MRARWIPCRFPLDHRHWRQGLSLMHSVGGSRGQTLSEQLFSWILPSILEWGLPECKSWVLPLTWLFLVLKKGLSALLLYPLHCPPLTSSGSVFPKSSYLRVPAIMVDILMCISWICIGFHFKVPKLTMAFKKTNWMSPSFSRSLEVVAPGHGVVVDTRASPVLWLCRVWPPFQNHHGPWNSSRR